MLPEMNLTNASTKLYNQINSSKKNLYIYIYTVTGLPPVYKWCFKVAILVLMCHFVHMFIYEQLLGV